MLASGSLLDMQRNYLPLRSVDTPVAKRPFEATAREPPRSTVQASAGFWTCRLGKTVSTHACYCTAVEYAKSVLCGLVGV